MGCLKLTYDLDKNPLQLSKSVNRAKNIAQGFISVDPLKDDYPYYTSYQYAGNKPIIAIDLDGLEEAVVPATTDPEAQGEKQKVQKYINPEIEKFSNNVDKFQSKLDKTKQSYIAYYQSTGKLGSEYSEADLNNVLSDQNKLELNRIEGLMNKNLMLLSRAISLESQWNKLDSDIGNVVHDFNNQAGLTGEDRLDPNLVKAVMFSETEMGTGLRYTKIVNETIKFTDAYGFIKDHPYHQLNLGGVTDLDLYNKTVERFNIKVDRLSNFRSFGNINDVKLTAGALILKNAYAKKMEGNKYLDGSKWYNAVVAFKGASAEGQKNADNVFNLHNSGMHPTTPNFRLFNP